jgi:Trypsin
MRAIRALVVLVVVLASLLVGKVAGAQSEPGPEYSAAIANGDLADVHPAVVRIDSRTAVCSGVVLYGAWVLTAKPCTDDGLPLAVSYDVNFDGFLESVTSVASVIRHPTADLAIVRLERDTGFSQILQIPTRADRPAVKAPGVITVNFGIRPYDNSFPDDFVYVAPFVTDGGVKCGPLPATGYCFGGVPDPYLGLPTGICKGDSGGPAVWLEQGTDELFLAGIQTSSWVPSGSSDCSRFRLDGNVGEAMYQHAAWLRDNVPGLQFTPPLPAPQPVAPPAPQPPRRPPPTGSSGYYMADASGVLYEFGTGVVSTPSVPLAPGERVADIKTDPTGVCVYVLTTHGAVYQLGIGFNCAPGDSFTGFAGTPSALAVAPDAQGFWVFTDRGEARASGSVQHYGDMATVALNGPIVAAAATPSGGGYWLIGSDGGVFTFGDAGFYGSMGGRALNRPVNGIVPDPDGQGYWLVASDGGIFAFSAAFQGSLGGLALNAPIVGAVSYGSGYLMVGADGGAFNFSDRAFAGSLGSNPPASPVVSISAFG